MTAGKGIILLMLLWASSYALVSGQPYGEDIRRAVETFGQAEVTIAYPGFAAMSDMASRYPVSSCDGKSATLVLSPLNAPQFIAEGKEYILVKNDPVKAAYTASSVAAAMQWHSYPTFSQYDTIMHLFASQWPDICTLDTIGFSVMGRPVYVIRISDGAPQGKEEGAVMLSSSIHGDELGGFVMMLRLIHHLASEAGKGGLASKLVSGLDIWINPLANPDGMYRDGDSIISPVRANANGYDLNRNFPDPEDPAPQPLQKETADMGAFLASHRFSLSANFHGGVEVVNYPWDKWTRLHPDDLWFNAVSRRYADTVHVFSSGDYMTYLENGVTRGSEWYVIRGGRQDYVTWGLGGREVTVELDRTKQTPAGDLEELWNFNRQSFLRYMEEALYGLRGTVTDYDTGGPLEARLLIPGHDSDSSQVYSSALTGSYIRFMYPGTYTVTFSAPGYRQFTTEVNVTGWNEPVYLEVRLKKEDGQGYPDPPGSGLLIYPNPAGGEFSIMPPVVFEGAVSVLLSTVTGALVEQYKTFAYQGVPIVYNRGNLHPGTYIVTVRKEQGGATARGKVVINTFITR